MRRAVPHGQDQYVTDVERIHQWALAHLVEIVEEYGGVKVRRGRCRCPIHNGQRPSSFSIKPGRGWYCHTDCNRGGGGVEFVRLMRFANLPAADGKRAARAELAPRVGIAPDALTRRRDDPGLARRLAQNAPPPERDVYAERVAALCALADGTVAQLPPAVYREIMAETSLGPKGRDYLAGRGLSAVGERLHFRSIETPAEWKRLHNVLSASFTPDELELARLYRPAKEPDAGLVWAPLWGGHVPALLVPYILHGEVVAFQLRDMRDGVKQDKYRAIQPDGYELPPFNADVLDGCAGDVLHVCEGELNAATLHHYGVRAIGLKAARWPESWTPRLRDVRRLVVWFDADQHSDPAALSLGATLQATFGASWRRTRTRRVPLPPGPDGKNLDANDLHLRGVLREYIDRAAA